MRGVVIFYYLYMYNFCSIVLSLFLYVHLHANQQSPSVFVFLISCLFLPALLLSLIFFIIELMIYNYIYLFEGSTSYKLLLFSGSLHSSHDKIMLYQVWHVYYILMSLLYMKIFFVMMSNLVNAFAKLYSFIIMLKNEIKWIELNWTCGGIYWHWYKRHTTWAIYKPACIRPHYFFTHFDVIFWICAEANIVPLNL